jgi:hypothetical protein
MAEIVNLKRARKTKLRSAKEQAAEENRVRFGTAKKERDRARVQSSLEEKTLAGNRLDSEKPSKA